MQKLRIVIGGFIGLMPAGGVTWDYIQYVLGFRELGHDVTYVEDTRLYPVYSKSRERWDDCTELVQYLSVVMQQFGLHNNWCYRDEASGAFFGMTESAFKETCKRADVFINISCSTFMRDEYVKIPVRILIDTDPMFTQIQYLTTQIFTPGKNSNRQLLDAHTHHYTFGENIGRSECRIPKTGIIWKTTRQPICLNEWKPAPLPQCENVFSTIMNWSAGKKLSYDGEYWGQKDVEFQKFIELPNRLPCIDFRIVVSTPATMEASTEVMKIQSAGWNVLDPELHTTTISDYMNFIHSSTGEFSVAKETYVKGSTGWFSCRSACYLAAGRPVVTQDTGWSSHIPSGEGLFAFENPDDAAFAVETIIENPMKHSSAARQLAETYFDSKKVLAELLNCI